MYTQLETELTEREEIYSDYEEYPDILKWDIEKNVKYLYENVGIISKDEMMKIIRISEKYLQCLKDDEKDLYYIKCNSLLLEVLKLFILDEIDNGVTEHIFQCKCGEIIEDEEFNRDTFEQTMLLIGKIVSDLRDILYYYEESKIYVEEVIRFIECKKSIMMGDYFTAYIESKTILSNLFKKEDEYLENIPDYKEEDHRNWIKKKFDFCLEIGSIIGEIEDLQKSLVELSKLNIKSISDKDIKELKTQGDVEVLCGKHISHFRNSFNSAIRKYFKNCNLEENNNLEYMCSMKYFNQKVLSKIIEEDSTQKEDSYINLNKELITICDSGIELIGSEYRYNERYNFFRQEFMEKKLQSQIWLWDTYSKREKEDVVKRISVYKGENPIVKNMCYVLDLIKSFNNNDDDKAELYSLFGKYICLLREVTYLEKWLMVWDENKEYAFYTTLNTFSFLLLDEREKIEERKNRLSLMNSSYMNDPNEGNVLFDICGENSEERKNNKIYELLINENGKKVRKKYNNSLVFLKSFSKKIDKLTMWSEYGDKGEGCCIVVDGSTFKRTKKKLKMINDSNVNCYADDEFELYNILYWNSKKNEFILNGAENEVAAGHISKIIDYIVEICNYAEKMRKDDTWFDGIVNSIQRIVIKISYLIKYEEYQDEEESRIILIRNNYNEKNDIETIQNYNEPLKSMLFVHYPIKTRMNEIIMGPKVLDSDSYAPFILKKLSEINKGNQKITKLSISSIDYR